MPERIEYGHTFREDSFFPGTWCSTEGNAVIVTKPRKDKKNWEVFVVATNKTLEMSGEDAERRAFCVAEIFTKQQLTNQPKKD